MTMAENLALQTYYKEPLSHKGILNFAKIKEYARQLMTEFDVRGAGEHVLARGFSGGNQQKQLLLVKWIAIQTYSLLANRLVV